MEDRIFFVKTAYKKAYGLGLVRNKADFANAYIRKACKTAGIDAPLRLVSFRGSTRTEVVKPKWECMTFHAARRTFITMALLLEIPIPVIMSWSGHKDVKMLKPYMAVVDEMRRREMSKFDAL